MRFRGIRLVEQTEQTLRRTRLCLEEKQNKPRTAKVGAISKAQKV